ncbi:hypothetical protein B0O80DRAFT_462102 [Mortierella sp. GBAus27b]|nr:hypothetical protein B0O80DRAFT_462102 [Mortierella sp. GBAus27b]
MYRGKESLLSLVLLTHGSGTRLVVCVANGLIDNNVLLVAIVGVEVVFWLVSIHLGEPLRCCHLPQQIVLELVCLLELALIFIVLFGFGLAFVFPMSKIKRFSQANAQGSVSLFSRVDALQGVCVCVWGGTYLRTTGTGWSGAATRIPPTLAAGVRLVLASMSEFILECVLKGGEGC